MSLRGRVTFAGLALAGVVCWGPGALADQGQAPESNPPSGKAQDQDYLQFETWPPGAEVRVITGDPYKDKLARGRTPNVIPVTKEELRGDGYEVEFSLPGHRSLKRQFPVDKVVNRAYEEKLYLTPNNAWVAFLDWYRGNAIAITLGLGLAGFGLFNWWGRRRGSRQLQATELQVIELARRAEQDDLVGVVLGGYKLTCLLGRGGAAEVYLGEKGQEKVAVKVLHSTGLDEMERFKREVKAAQTLQHPALLVLYGYGEERGRLFLILELMEGGCMRELLRGPLEPERALELLKPLFEATAYAHRQGVVHRDLKPENVMVSRQGKLKIADFGMAKLTAMNTVTQDGTILGTPAYMAPEQVQGVSREPAIDQYALGVMTFEVLMGRLPFVDEENPVRTIFMHLSEPVPPMTPSVTPAIEAVVHRMLAKEVHQRFSSVSEAWSALEAALNSASQAAP